MEQDEKKQLTNAELKEKYLSDTKRYQEMFASAQAEYAEAGTFELHEFRDVSGSPIMAALKYKYRSIDATLTTSHSSNGRARAELTLKAINVLNPVTTEEVEAIDVSDEDAVSLGKRSDLERYAKWAEQRFEQRYPPLAEIKAFIEGFTMAASMPGGHRRF